MRCLLDVLDGVPLLLDVTPGISQVHLAERTGTDLALDDERFTQLAERLVFRRRRALCQQNTTKRLTYKHVTWSHRCVLTRSNWHLAVDRTQIYLTAGHTSLRIHRHCNASRSYGRGGASTVRYSEGNVKKENVKRLPRRQTNNETTSSVRCETRETRPFVYSAKKSDKNQVLAPKKYRRKGGQKSLRLTRSRVVVVVVVVYAGKQCYRETTT